MDEKRDRLVHPIIGNFYLLTSEPFKNKKEFDYSSSIQKWIVSIKKNKTSYL